MFFKFINNNNVLFSVQRVHWLRARAQHHRWREETILVGYEMQWTVRYFIHQSELWKKRSNSFNNLPGTVAYGARQAARWFLRASAADIEFKLCNKSYVPLIN